MRDCITGKEACLLVLGSADTTEHLSVLWHIFASAPPSSSSRMEWRQRYLKSQGSSPRPLERHSRGHCLAVGLVWMDGCLPLVQHLPLSSPTPFSRMPAPARITASVQSSLTRSAAASFWNQTSHSAADKPVTPCPGICLFVAGLLLPHNARVWLPCTCADTRDPVLSSPPLCTDKCLTHIDERPKL